VEKATRFKLVDIRLVWNDIRPHIEKLKADWNMDWKAEDVYAQCLMGKAFCHTCDDGFVIVQPRQSEYTLDKELFVWICYSTANDGLTEYYDDICLMAKSVYATTIKFCSPREGFRKLAKQNNWQAMTEYTITI